jgi:hypothetical protein
MAAARSYLLKTTPTLNTATLVVPAGNDFGAFVLSVLTFIDATDTVCATVCADAGEEINAHHNPMKLVAVNILFIVWIPFLGRGQPLRFWAITKSPRLQDGA